MKRVERKHLNVYSNHEKVCLLVRIPLGRQGLTFTTKYLWGYRMLTNKGIIFFDDRNEMLSLVIQFVANQNFSLCEIILSLLFADL